MVSEALQPLVKELPINEKRRLLVWLQGELEEIPEVVNYKLRKRLIRHITKTNKTIANQNEEIKSNDEPAFQDK